MPCTYTFKGVTYTEKEFKDYIADNREALTQEYGDSIITPDRTTPNLEESLLDTYNNSALLQKIGTFEDFKIFNHNYNSVSPIEFAKHVEDTILPSGETKEQYAEYMQNKPILTEQLSEYSSTVDYNLKAVDILLSDKAVEVFNKGEKNKWSLDKILTELAIPKEQKALILKLGITDRDAIIVELTSQYSYAVKVEVALQKYAYNASDPVYDTNGRIIHNGDPTQYYANLTVPGGINYTENEIATPLITPSIKGHAQFSTDNGIGWFRSDEKAVSNGLTPAQIANIPEEYKQEALQGSKTRRILELQSDLFQKGREHKKLTGQDERIGDTLDDLLGTTGKKEFDSRGNQFLQLLNKDNNWVTFFIKSIIQDSAKKGYLKVLFPTGETAAKVEGHETIAEELTKINDSLEALQENKVIIKERLNYPPTYEIIDKNGNTVIGEISERTLEIIRQEKLIEYEQRKQELKSQGIEKLKPIEAFYERRVTNILNKTYSNNVKLITDEYDNTWNEVTITPEMQNNIQLAEYTSDVVEVFKANPALQEIGTIIQYREYLDTVFPDSQVKDILHHGTRSGGKFSKFDSANLQKYDSGWFGRGFYFTKYPYIARTYADMPVREGEVENRVVMQVVLNITNPQYVDVKLKDSNIIKVFDTQYRDDSADGVISYKVKDGQRNFNTPYTEYRVDSPEQIHILGTSQDQELFRRYVAKQTLPDITPEQVEPFIRTTTDELDAVFASDSITAAEKSIIESAVKYTNASLLAYANRIRREKQDKLVPELIQVYQENNIGSLDPKVVLDDIEKQQLVVVLAKDYEINAKALRGTGDSRSGLLYILDRYADINMELIINNDESRREFADFMKKMSIYIKSFNRVSILESNTPTELWDERTKAINNLVKLHQGLMPDVVNITNRFNNLLERFFEARVKSITSNPNVIQGVMEVFTAQDDESLVQLKLDSLVDTHNVFVANIVKLYLMEMGKAQEEIIEETTKFKRVLMQTFGLTNIKDVDKIKEEAFYKYFEIGANGKPTGRIIQEYDWDRFQKEQREFFESIEGLSENARSRLAWEWYKENQVNLGFSNNDINIITKEMKETLTPSQFEEWINKNFTLTGNSNNNNKKKKSNQTRYIKGYKATGMFARPANKFRNPNFDAVKDDPLYKYLVETLIKLGEEEGIPNLITQGYLPAINKHAREGRAVFNLETLNEWFNSHKAKVGEQFIGENHELIRVLQFPMSEMLSQKPKINIRKQEDDEDTATYEERVLRETEEAGLGVFTSIKEIREYNRNIDEENKKLHAERANLNIRDVIDKFIREATTYKYKKSMESEMLLALEKVRTLEMTKRDSKGNELLNRAAKKITGKNTKETVIKGQSNLELHLSEWLDAIFYGNFDIDEGNLTAIGKIFLKYVSAKNMWLNVTSGVNNIAYGHLMMLAETAASNFISKEDAVKAESMYWANVTGMFADIKTPTSDNLLVAILKRLDIVESQTEKEIGAKALYKHFISTNSLYALQEMGEHYMQNKMLIAMMNSHRIINGKIVSFNDYKGDNRYELLTKILSPEELMKLDEYIAMRLEKETRLDSKHNYVEDFIRKFLTLEQAKAYVAMKKKTDEELRKEFEDKANMRVLDMFELVDGMARIKKTSDGEQVVTPERLEEFRLRVMKVNQKVHGIYNKVDASTIQRRTWGKFAMQFRKWARPGWNKRFGTKFGKSFWNEARGQWDEGSYIATLGMLTRPFRDNPMYTKGEGLAVGKALSNIANDYIDMIRHARTYWAVLSDHDKGLIKSASVEMLAIAAVLILGKALSGMGDDDEENKKATTFLDFNMYQIDRLYSELMVYNPIGLAGEAQKIIRSPTATYSSAMDIAIFFRNATSYYFIPEEKRYYRGGPYSKELKVEVMFNKLIPLINQYQRLERLGTNNMYYNLISHAR